MEDQLAELDVRLKATEAKQEELQFKSDQCTNRLDRAQKLIGGLGGERGRWEESVRVLTDTYDCLTGDVLLSRCVSVQCIE